LAKSLGEILLSIGPESWKGASAGLQKGGIVNTGAKRVQHRAIDNKIAGCLCDKGSSAKHLTFGPFCQEKGLGQAGHEAKMC